MRNIATWCVRHRKTVLAGWLVALIALGGALSSAGSGYENSFGLKGTQSYEAQQLLKQAAPKAAGDREQIVIAVNSGSLKSPAVKRRAERMLARVAKLPEVAAIVSPYSSVGAGQISKSGRVAFANVTMTKLATSFSVAQSRQFVNSARAGAGSGLQVAVAGQVAEQSEPGNDSSAGLGALAALVVLLLVFGSLLAALLPLLTAGLALGVGVSVIGLLSNVITMASFSSQLSILIGLGVGVDYALFIVTRHRQGLQQGKTVEEAIVDALDTSGRAVLFAGITVCIALLGMFALGVSFLYGVAIAAAVVVSFTVLAALTLLPAMLGFMGTRVLGRRGRRKLADGQRAVSHGGGFWVRWTGALERRPLAFALAALLVMGTLAAPFFSMRLGSSDASSDPAGTTTRQAYELLAKGFGAGYNGPLQLVAEVSDANQKRAFDNTLTAVAHTAGVAAATPAVTLPGSSHGKAVVFANVYPDGSPQAASTSSLLTRLRDGVIPASAKHTGLKVLVGGQTAIFADFASVLSSKLPLFIGVVVLLSFLLLAAVFRSIAIPLMAAAMNMLSAGAAFGVLVAVFQWGWLDSLLGVSQTGPIEAFVPVMMFAILFGLSMDYEVFLVSRIYEEWHRTGDNRLAVTRGLQATGRTISAAAMIMVLVFGSFLLGGQVVIKMFGLGLAGAVLLDAAIVRMALVPALMLLLGERNWALPGWLDRVLPHLNVEGSVAAPDAEHHHHSHPHLRPPLRPQPAES
ncbi:MAG TPA: MMPL family transporter [Solirubrobacteraceae bacterium]|nr:MMPL family transporter [Solirubrobacteraceae bacterium]